MRRSVNEHVVLPLGLGSVTPKTATQVADWVLTGGSDGPRFIGNLNLHALSVARQDRTADAFNRRADLCLIDGMPILVLASLAARRSLSPSVRIGSSDWIDELIRRDPAMCVVAVGGTEDTATKAAAAVSARASNIEWLAYDGFDFTQRAGTRTPMESAVERADLVLVALGMPLQEQLIHRLAKPTSSAIFANVGGCLDYLAGNQALAPRWLGRIGLEWLYRLAHDPRRLWRRYLVEPVALVAAVMSDIRRARR